jgi:hypothetical protein
MRSAEFAPSLRATFNHPPYVLGQGTSVTTGRDDMRVSVDVPAGGIVTIQAAAFSRGMQGAYTLQVIAN